MLIIEVVASTRMSNVVRFRSFLRDPYQFLWGAGAHTER